ncbi:hypothetical protein [Aestuariibacter salexigens]|uniref:hypothetical protein n=1 Tax=Aestuariibacter salexigens TaxID=226010 RepID=UPI00047B8FE7|nr:hypothetical protein [Aestuariibacter salexigens]
MTKTVSAARASAFLLLTASLPCAAQAEFAGEMGVQQRYFLQDALLPEQERAQFSVYAQPEWYHSWNDGYDSLLFRPFVRYDEVDSERTHIDIRELIWLHVSDNWELRTGIGKVFWGQTESLHLVDVINQVDLVETIDYEDRLGQPMVNFSYIMDMGTLSAFVLPYFRERTFAGPDGRLQLPLPVDTDNPLYESSDEERHIDWAVRYQATLGDWELGLSYFDGTSREPFFVPAPNPQSGEIQLRPFYAQMQQVGVDTLAVAGSWLIKFEAIYRDVLDDDFFAAVGGVEYTSVGVFDSMYDLGLLIEYQFDERDELSWTGAQNDLMIGTRIVFNDIDGTEVLLGVIQDLDNSSTRGGLIEASSRMTDRWKWRLDAYFFSSDTPTDVTYAWRRDDYVEFTLEYYF